MNIATTLGAAGLGALMSPLPGGAFVGALVGHFLASVAVDLYRGWSRPALSPPLLGRDLSLLRVRSDNGGAGR